MSKFSAKRANLGLKWENLGLKLENLEQKWANLGRYQARRVPRVSITEHRASRVREKMDRAPSIEYSARYSCITRLIYGMFTKKKRQLFQLEPQVTVAC